MLTFGTTSFIHHEQGSCLQAHQPPGNVETLLLKELVGAGRSRWHQRQSTAEMIMEMKQA